MYSFQRTKHRVCSKQLFRVHSKLDIQSLHQTRYTEFTVNQINRVYTNELYRVYTKRVIQSLQLTRYTEFTVNQVYRFYSKPDI